MELEKPLTTAECARSRHLSARVTDNERISEIFLGAGMTPFDPEPMQRGDLCTLSPNV